MKKFTSLKSILFVLLLFPAIQFYGQISIVASDWESGLQIGETYTSYLDRVTKQVDIGSLGLTSWDFSSLVVSNEFVTESKPFSSSPYTADFPGSEYASYYEGTFEGVFSKTWVYNSMGATYVTHGTGTVANSPAGLLTTKIKFTPAWEHYVFPISQGYSHTYTGTQTVTTIVNIPGFGDFPTVLNQGVTIETVVDAWGIVKMPGGKRLNALRLKETTTFNNNGNLTSQVVFAIITKTGEMVSITPTDKNATSGVISIASISWASGKGESIPEETMNAPTALSSFEGLNQTIGISWTDNSANETGFVIERSANGAAFAIVATVGANVTNYTDTGVTPGITYTYRVKAVGNGIQTGYSNTTSTTIPLVIPVTAPSGLLAIAGANSIEISWSDNSDNETGFVIERSSSGGLFSVLSIVEPNETAYTDVTAVAGISYTYRVKATGGTTGSDYSNTSAATIPAIIPVTAPSNLAATAGSSLVSLSWIDNSDNETGFTIERSANGDSFSELISIQANSVAFTDLTAQAGVTYLYRVFATGTTSNSGYSNVASASIPVIPVINAPSGLTALGDENSVSLTWSDNSTNETGFTVERSSSLSGTYSEISNLPANSTSFVDNDVTGGFQFFYRVKATGASSDSEYSNTASASVPLIVVVSDPSGLIAIENNHSINLAWIDNSDNETGFVVERSSNGGSFAIIANLASNTTTFDDANVYSGIEYSYRVKAIGSTANSNYSNTAQITIPIVETVAVPSGLTATASESFITLSWVDNSDNETGFVIERAEQGGGFSIIATLPKNTVSYTDESVSAGVEYTYRVMATGSSTNSAYSTTTTVTIIETVGLSEMNSIIFKLGQNYPNPVVVSTTIPFELNQDMHITISVFDLTGKMVEQIVSENYPAGKHSVRFERKALSKGIYFYSLVTGSSKEIRKMLVE